MTEQEQLTRILTLVEQLERDWKETNKSIEDTNQRIEGINQRIEDTNQRIEGINQRIEDTNQRIEGINQRIEDTNQRIEDTNQRIEDTNQRIEEEVKRWDERFFQLVKEQGATARTIIIAAASVVVLSPVLGAVVDIASRFLPLLPQD